jgi:histidinol-phosphate/aromatic aminotransferase/cobyric acid decarboxylase-like protein
LVETCRKKGLFLRDNASMGGQLGPDVVRIAVKDSATNDRMVAILATILGRSPGLGGIIDG